MGKINKKLGTGLVLGAVAAAAAGVAEFFFNPKTGKKHRVAAAKEVKTLVRKAKAVEKKVVRKVKAKRRR
jgi:gas vesicle protein